MNHSSHETPRYRIDEDVPQVETKLLPVEQARIIEKLVRLGGHSLESSERELMDRLLDRLVEEGDRMRALQAATGAGKPLDTALRKAKATGAPTSGNHRSAVEAIGAAATGSGAESLSSAPEPSGPVEDEMESPPPTETRVIGYKPEEVVQRYIECWNRQMFGAEYDCFSRSFLSMPRDDYVARRQQTYRQALGTGGQDMRFIEIVDVSSSGYEAEVVSVKSVREGNRPEQQQREQYRLRVEDGHWVIYFVRPAD